MTNFIKSNKFLDNKSLNSADKNNLDFVYNLISNDIEIEVKPEFINNQVGILGDVYVWSYDIKIFNHSTKKVKLLNRHWRIIDENGSLQKVDGEGVVGKQPEILSGESFKYNSGVHLACPSGIMSGYYEMIDEDNNKFNVEIPSFSLDIPSAEYILN